MYPLENLVMLFEQNRNKAQAIPMKKYLKNHFSFLGIKTPERTVLMKKFYHESGLLEKPFNHEFVLSLWGKKEREYQHAALDYIGRSLNKLHQDDLPLMEKLITTKSWWDTVDMLATKPVGTIAKKFPVVIPNQLEGWSVSDHMWLRRTAILFQLKYKEETNEELLYKIIQRNSDSKEFFIQKAIGWSLREYSKTNPQSVKQFINNSNLQRLSVREGSKYID